MSTTGATLGSFMASPIPLAVSKTANYVVTAADNGTVFDNSGASTTAIVFTLPTLAAGLFYEFQGIDNGSITIASALGSDMVTFNDVGANSIASSTSSEKIGSRLFVRSNAAGTKWYCGRRSSTTVTVAT